LIVSKYYVEEGQEPYVRINLQEMLRMYWFSIISFVIFSRCFMIYSPSYCSCSWMGAALFGLQVSS
jgi:hypothetical protein